MDRAEGLRDGAVIVICSAWAHKHEWEQLPAGAACVDSE